MKKSRFTEGQILAILKLHEAGVPVADLSREHDFNIRLACVLSGISGSGHSHSWLRALANRVENQTDRDKIRPPLRKRPPRI